MTPPEGAGPRFLVAESETLEQREQRRASVGRSSGETYLDTLRALVPGAACDLARPSEEGAEAPGRDALAGYDAVFLTGSPLHVYRDTPAVRRQLAFMRDVFASGTPAFGSCAGLQVAVAAAGGTVRESRRGHEAAFARRIVATAAGRDHPLLAGRPAAWDAPAIHTDEVERLPEGAVLLAGNAVSAVQAAEIRHGGGVFWGVQYHPELTLGEVAAAVRRQAEDLLRQGLAHDRRDLDDHADRIEALHREPSRRDLAWQLGLDRQVTDPALRQTELRNFIAHLVRPVMRSRRRGG
ncbi:type 1 glutamine amidotransferase [Paeniroseomonas aquatica]|uniref:Type 1 glutamine amidotransferase n=1 Tax=Paeniroseomonas aquatica TaxID=373043 RepID=A0ABT8AC84_9PROT|nr:type 1 glutamine amidotransferase [Paeniroseomonas aquatica]MDN3567133.1 type 1 glutamine amidotransferase [Paeniroseomonas aquatica]